MTLEDRLAIARDLIARRDAIDAELEALFTGTAMEPKPRRRRQTSTDPQRTETSIGEPVADEQHL